MRIIIINNHSKSSDQLIAEVCTKIMASNVRRSRGRKESASDVARRLSYTGSQDRRRRSATSGFYGSESSTRSADLQRGGPSPPQHARYSHYSDCIVNNHTDVSE